MVADGGGQGLLPGEPPAAPPGARPGPQLELPAAPPVGVEEQLPHAVIPLGEGHLHAH